MIGQTFVHGDDPRTWTVIGADRRFVTLLSRDRERWTVAAPHFDLCFRRVDDLPRPDGVGRVEGAALLVGLALAAGVLSDESRPVRGQQPASEFNVAPFSPFVRVTLSDENLETVLHAWSGGAQ